MVKNIDVLLAEAKAKIDAMSEQEIRQMLEIQARSWAKSEAQWAKDFAEGKCERD